MNWIHYTIIFGVIGGLSATLVWALWWALRGGQFSNFQRGAESIFDEDEPIGSRTDAFPGEELAGHRECETISSADSPSPGVSAPPPSPGTPGKGRGEGLIANSTLQIANPQDPHPNPLPEYRARGPEGNPPRSGHALANPAHRQNASGTPIGLEGQQ